MQRIASLERTSPQQGSSTNFHIHHLECNLCNQATHLMCCAPMILEENDSIFLSFGSSLFAMKVISVFLLGRKLDDRKMGSCLEQGLLSMSPINTSYFYVFVSVLIKFILCFCFYCYLYRMFIFECQVSRI